MGLKVNGLKEYSCTLDPDSHAYCWKSLQNLSISIFDKYLFSFQKMADSHICNTYSINVIPSFHNKTKDTDKGTVIDKTEMQKPTHQFGLSRSENLPKTWCELQSDHSSFPCMVHSGKLSAENWTPWHLECTVLEDTKYMTYGDLRVYFTQYCDATIWILEKRTLVES